MRQRASQKQLPTLLAPTAKPLGTRTAASGSRRQSRTRLAVGAKTTKAGYFVRTTALASKTFSRSRHVKERFNVDPDKYLDHGSVVIAAITSCTNTSNPSVMLAAGILAKKAVEKGPHRSAVGEDLARPGSRVVTDYYQKSGLLPYLEKLRFNVVGYGCTTCIGNSGPLPTDVSKSIDEHGLVAVSVLSGNRNFEGRVNVDVRANYLMTPPLVVAYALAGRIGHNFETEPLGNGPAGKARISQRHLANAAGSSRGHRKGRQQRGFRKEYAPSATATPAGRASVSRPATSTSGSPTRPTFARRHTSTA